MLINTLAILLLNVTLDSTINLALDGLGLTRQDLTFQTDYEEPDAFRFNMVNALMQNPLALHTSLDSLMLSLRDTSVHQQLLNLNDIRTFQLESETFSISTEAIDATIELWYDANDKWKQFLSSSSKAWLDDSSSYHAILSWQNRLSSEELEYLRSEAPTILLEDEDTEKYNVFELEAIKRENIAKADSVFVLAAKLRDIPVEDFMKNYWQLLSAFEKTKSENTFPAALNNLPLDLQGRISGRIHGAVKIGELGWGVIGGFGDNIYKGNFAFIIELGGNDRYQLTATDTNLPMNCIYDLEGNDSYISAGDFGFGSSYFGSALLIDVMGNDVYQARNYAQGCGFFGVGILWDKAGHDKYFGDTGCQGAAFNGIGILRDDDGSDIYHGALHCQGFGYVGGIGYLEDRTGNDSYLLNSTYTDILRYEDHVVTLGQGFGYGYRPDISGGIGLLQDYEGNDLYVSDIYGQGAAYWYALGALFDRKGNDNYQSYQYAQGAGIHLALGLLQDDAGDDTYHSKGVSQGCGHDLGMGWLLDIAGNDTYTAWDLCQGAGSANGFAIFSDLAGDDFYGMRRADNSQGYGNPRRDYGSVGLFLDLSGTDIYTFDDTKNESIWLRGLVGIGVDLKTEVDSIAQTK